MDRENGGPQVSGGAGHKRSRELVLLAALLR